MSKNFLSVLILVFITFTSGVLSYTIDVQGQTTSDYYYVDDQKVNLSVSETYKAYALKSGLSASSREELDAEIKAAGVGSITKTSVLERAGIVLVRSKKDVGPSTFMSGMASLSRRSEVESEVPVYAVGETDLVLMNEFIVQFKSEVPETRINEILAENNAKVVRKYTKVNNRYVLTFEGKSPKEALGLSNSIHQSDDVRFSEPNFIQILPAHPEIKSSATNSLDPAPMATTPDDPLFQVQWGLHNTGNPVGVADADIDAPEAWDHQTGSNQVIIAVIDEGVDIHHPDLADKIVTPYDATDGDNNQDPQSCAGHGTSCAGIAAAIGNNGLGVAGVAWNPQIMPVRLATVNDCSLPPNMQRWVTTNTIIEDAIRTSVDRGAHVLSNSWRAGPSNLITDAIDYAISNNRVVVIAAGNASGPVSYPANLSSSKTIIAVSATNEWDEFKTKTSQDGEFWWGSNFGPEVNIAAPGVHIATTDIRGADGYTANDYIETFNGTSSATPFVAGAAALLLSQDPSLTPTQVRDQLQDSADDLGPSGFDNQFGHGRLNVDKALPGGGKSTDIAFYRPGFTWTTFPVLLSKGDGSWDAKNLAAPSWANQPDVIAIPGDY
ncbi:MAG: S8 family serine peptidase, partial [Planctomycetes bacterium]|nr:S8 family serine peptidase [Planctomycetota bacterium]